MKKSCVFIISGIASLAFAGPPNALTPGVPRPNVYPPQTLRYEFPPQNPAEVLISDELFTSGKTPATFEYFCKEENPKYVWRKKPLTLEQERERQHRYLAYLADQLTSKMEEFGTVTFSAPILALPDKMAGQAHPPFQFGLDYTADKYYQLNKDVVSAAVGSAERSVQSLGLGIEVSQDQIARDIWGSKQRAFDQQQAIYRGDRLFYEQGQLEKKSLFEAEKKALDDKLKADLAAAAALTKEVDRTAAEAKARADYAVGLKALTSAYYPAAAPAIPTLPYPSVAADPAAAAAQPSGTAPVTGQTGEQSAYDFNNPIIPALPSGSVPEPANARAILSNISRWPALSAVANASPELPPRTTMINAYGDKMVQSIFNFLGDPAAAVPFKDKVILFGVSTVSVNPGWRSQKDFAADVSIKCSYRSQKARIETVMRLLTDERYPEDIREEVARSYGLEFETKAEAKKKEDKKAAKDKEAKDKETAARKAQDAQEAVQKAPAVAQAAFKAKNEELLTLEATWEKAVAESAFQQEAVARQKAAVAQAEEEEKKAVTDDEKKRLAEKTAIQKKIAEEMSAEWIRKQSKAKTLQFAAEIATQELERLAQQWKSASDKALRAAAATPSPTEHAPDLVKGQKKVLAPWNGTFPPGIVSGETVSPSQDTVKAPTTASDIYRQAPDWLKFEKNKDLFSAPLVAGVSPLMETQTLDLESQWRQQTEFALKLAVLMQEAGMKANAGAFEQFVKNRQSDARSMTSSATVSSYSAGGGTFGFQIGPRLQALADPASKKAGQGRVLERQAFPVLVIFGLDRKDVTPTIDLQDDGKLVVMENGVQFEQISRWTHMLPPLHHRFNLFKPSTWEPHNRWSEGERFEWNLYLQQVMRQVAPLQEHAKKLYGEKPGTFLEEGALISRIQQFASLANSTVTWISTPVDIMLHQDYQKKAPADPKPPRIASLKQIFPSEVVFGPDEAPREVSFVITGTNLDILDLPKEQPAWAQLVQPGSFFTITGFAAPTKETLTVKGLLNPQANVGGNFGFAIQQAIASTSGQERVFSPFVRVRSIPKTEPRQVETTEATPQGTITRTVRVTGNVEEATLQQAVQRGDKPSAKPATSPAPTSGTSNFKIEGTLKKE